MQAAPPLDKTPLTQGELWSALLPWIIVCVLMLIWGNGAFKTWANANFVWNYPVPELDKLIFKVPPVAAKPTAEGAVFAFTWLSFTGTGMLIVTHDDDQAKRLTNRRMILADGRLEREIAA